MPKTDAFSEFRPSFISVGVGWLPELFEEAFREASPKITAQLGQEDDSFSAQGMVGAGKDRPIRFGHARAIAPIGDDLSGAAPYQLTVTFDDDDKLKEVLLKLSLFNPRVVVANEVFIPANFRVAGNPPNRFETLTPDPKSCGFAVLYEPDTMTADERFLRLKSGIDDAVLDLPHPQGYLPFAAESLVGRLDLWINWKADTLGEISNDLFGRVIGTPDAAVPDGLNTAKLFSPATDVPFDSLVNKSYGFALELPHDIASGILIATGKPETMSDDAAVLYAKARRAFNLTEKFAGILFEGLRVHVLNDDHQCSVGDVPHGGVGLTAIALAGKEEKLGNWYTTFNAEMVAEPDKRYLGMFSRFAISAMLADRDVQQLQLKSRFATKLDAPFAWLSNRDAVLSITMDKWKDRLGKDQEGRAIGLSLETAIANEVLARLNAKTLGIGDDEFKALATAVTLAPIVLMPTPKAAEPGNSPPGVRQRGYFSVIRGAQTIPQLFAGAAVGSFFKDAIHVEEIRVVGIGVQVQPARINEPASPDDARETALLVDYETDFTVTLDSPDLKTERTVTARVDGTGIRVAGGELSWVQVPRGLHDLALADPGLWKLGELGKILKVVELSLRRDPVAQLAIRLHLTGDLGILTANDFIITVDLTSLEPKIEAFPSQVTIEQPNVFKATGKLYIDNSKGTKDIRGSLDVALTSLGWRAYAGARITHLEDGSGGKAKATIVSMALEWPTMIPVLSTGIGVKSVEGLLATHFARNVPPSTPAVPADLVWLKQAKGNVVTSIETKGLWTPTFGASTVALGLGMGAMSNPKLANFNAMLAIEEPGPQILIFAKLNLLKDPKPNKALFKDPEPEDDLPKDANPSDESSEDPKPKDKQPDSLGGILGLLQVDPVRSRILFAALADLEFSEFFQLRAPLEIAASWPRLSAWHAYLGHFDDPVSATLKFKSLASLNARGWLMAAGDEIRDVPTSATGKKTLPGLAVSTGLRLYAQIGPDFLCIRGDLATYIDVSISHVFYASGRFVISGELRLFIVSIGASGTFEAKYLSPSKSPLFISGEVCGKFEVSHFFSISGCVRLTLGGPVADLTTPPHLIPVARLVEGASVALHGQGQKGPIDAVLADASLEVANAPPNIPLDAVIVLNMDTPPRVVAGGAGFVARLTRPFENMRFYLGSREGHYLLKGVTLEREAGPGIWQHVEYGACPANWWHPHSPPPGEQPVPTSLAIMSRAPLSVSNALPAPSQLEAWIAALLGNICDTSPGPQRCFFMLRAEDRGQPRKVGWSLRAELPSIEIENLIGRAGATPSSLSIAPRAGADTPADPLPGYPAYPGNCRVARDSATGAAVPVLELHTHMVRNTWVHASATIAGPMLPSDPMLLILAHFSTDASMGVSVTVETRSGEAFYRKLDQTQFADLSVVEVQEAFHEKHARWQPQTEAFARLAGTPRFAGHHFVLATLDFIALGVAPDNLVEKVTLRFPNDLNADVARRLAMALLLGGYRFTTAAEKDRFENDEAARSGTVEGLNAYLKGERIPLLEPNSLYRVIADWDAVAGGSVAHRGEFSFRTASKPPKSAEPYLLATFPQDRESFHFAGENPGFCLASADALRILSKFPDARLRITVSEDNGAPVLDPGASLEWHRGIVYVPRVIFPDDVTKGPPPGLIIESVASLPSALRDALARHIRENDLRCLGPIDLPSGGLWIGLDAVLRPLSSYRITVQLVDVAGTLLFPQDEPFLVWQFKTGLDPHLSSYAERLRSARISHRTLAGPLAALPALASEQDLKIVADKLIEDAIAEAIGERILRSGETQLTVLWKASGAMLQAAAILVAGNEPLLRRTRSVRIEETTTTSSATIRIAEPADLLLVAPSLAQSTRIARFDVSSSGCILIAHLAPESSGVARIALERFKVELIASGVPVVEHIEVPEAKLAHRRIPE